MALDDHARAAVLPCGTLLDDLIAQVTEHTVPLQRAHQAACRHCQTALEAIRAIWEEFQQAAKAAVSFPEGLTERILQQTRLLTRLAGDGVTISSARGETRIGEQALARLAAKTALTVPEVLLATVLNIQESTEQPGTIAVELRLVVRFGPALQDVATAVREQVDQVLRAQTEIGATRVDVSIEDIIDTDGQPRMLAISTDR